MKKFLLVFMVILAMTFVACSGEKTVTEKSASALPVDDDSAVDDDTTPIDDDTVVDDDTTPTDDDVTDDDDDTAIEPGACCFTSTCSNEAPEQCLFLGGDFKGIGTDCATNDPCGFLVDDDTTDDDDDDTSPPTTCVIGGFTYQAGATNPANVCQWCQPTLDLSGWSDNDGATCDDGTYCNGMDTCLAGACAVNAGNPCPDDGAFCNGAELCDEFVDACVHSGNPCPDDSAFCNGVESCNEAVDTCVSSGNPCSDDTTFCNGVESCDEFANTCEHSGNPCPDDNEYCNGVESCDEFANLCAFSGDPCSDDGVYCNGNEVCSEAVNACEHTGTPCDVDQWCDEGLSDCSQITDQCAFFLVGDELHVEYVDVEITTILLGCENPDSQCDLLGVTTNPLGGGEYFIDLNGLILTYDAARPATMWGGFPNLSQCTAGPGLFWRERHDGGFIDLDNVYECVEEADFTVDPEIGTAGVESFFTDTSIVSGYCNADDLQYYWSFGDGSAPGFGPNPTHTYAAPGSYTVRLDIYDGLYTYSVEKTYEVVAAAECLVDADCNDDVWCNGAEFCSPQGDCMTGGNPCPSDFAFCNGVETCDEATHSCGHAGSPCEDDEMFCNGVEGCDETFDSCVHQGDPCESGEVCNEATNDCSVPPPMCDDNTDCDDGVFCNGAELCYLDSCAPAAPEDMPCADDGTFCNGVETCNEATDVCASSGDPCTGETCDEVANECVASTCDVVVEKLQCLAWQAVPGETFKIYVDGTVDEHMWTFPTGTTFAGCSFFPEGADDTARLAWCNTQYSPADCAVAVHYDGFWVCE